MSQSIRTVKAEDVENGDFLVGLDNGYVIDVDTNHDIRGDYNVRLGGEDTVLLTFNDAQGGENYLLVASDHPIDVKREDS